MSPKNIAHNSNVSSHHSNHNREVLIIIGIVLAVALIITLVTVQSNKTIATTNTIETASYSDAMAMQYAQPWLDKQAAAAAPAVRYSDAMAMQYAQPWLDKQAAAAPYSDPMGMQYAQPWLNTEKTTNCNGRLDMMYACQYGHQK